MPDGRSKLDDLSLHQLALAELCRRHTLALYAPATVLANRNYEYLYSLGPTEHYLRVPPGHATADLLAMVSEDLRAALRAAMLHAIQKRAPITIGGGQTVRDGQAVPYAIEVRPILDQDDELLAIHFVDQPVRPVARLLAAAIHDLRQPLQSLSLLHGLIAEHVDGAVSDQLVALLAETMGAMSGILHTLAAAPPDAPAALAPGVDIRPAPPRVRTATARIVFLVDDDQHIRDSMRLVLEQDGRVVHDFASGEEFFAAHKPGADGCLLVDAYLPGIDGLGLLQRLRAAGDLLPAIVITGNSDVSMAVNAMKAGAADFIEKPIAAADLLISIDRALERSRDSSKQMAWHASAAEHVAGLTPRQRQVMDRVLAGQASKNIAVDLGISQRTVENHRASIMRKMETKSLPALARFALAAAGAVISV